MTIGLAGASTTSAKSTKKKPTNKSTAKSVAPVAKAAPSANAAAMAKAAPAARKTPAPAAKAAPAPAKPAPNVVARLSPEAAIEQANKRNRIARGNGWVQTWDEPTYKDSTTGDNTTGEDLLVRTAAVDALGSLNGSIVVVDPETGVTKQALIDYYLAVAPLMLPHVTGRPLSLVRCPNGAGQKCF